MSWLRPDVFSREAALIDLARHFVPRGGVAWDVGANAGLFSFAAAGVAGEGGLVAAFEPEVSCLDLLNRSRKLLARRNARVEVFPLAISNGVGVEEFCVAPDCTAVSHLRAAGDPAFEREVSERRLVLTTTLDDLLGKIPAPSVVKIDVEGHEVAVLEGGRRLLQGERPVVLVEVLCGSHDRVGSLFRENSYELFDFSRGMSECRRLEGPGWNTLAVPKERLQDYPLLP